MHEREAASQAPHEQLGGQAPVDAATPAPRLGSLGPAGILALQRAAGNGAVTGLLQRDDTPATTPQQQPAQQAPPPPPPGPAAPGRTANLGAPPKSEGVQPGVDLAADAQSVTVTAVLHGVDAASIGSLDLGHEPSVSLQFTPQPQPQAVVQAAIAALNLHLRRHGTDIVEISVSPQVGVGAQGPQGGVQAQAEVHVTTSFSLTVSSSVTAQRHSDEPDPGNVRLGQVGPVDINWSPVTVGVLWHFGQGGAQRRPDQAPDYQVDIRDAAFIQWVRSQVDPADFDNGAQGEGNNTRDAIPQFITELADAMRSARGRDIADVQLNFGLMRVPDRITHGLTTAATLIARADPSLASLRLVRASVITEDAAGQRHVRWIPLTLR